MYKFTNHIFLLFPAVVLGYSAVQTDWSGEMESSPVVSWDDSYFDAFTVEREIVPGSLLLKTPGEMMFHDISSTVAKICTGDIDMDGDLDVVVCSWDPPLLCWWENLEGDGLSWAYHTIDSVTVSPRSAVITDIDGDGKMDVLLASYCAPNVVCYYQDNEFWTRETILQDLPMACLVRVCNVDGDEELEILAGSPNYIAPYIPGKIVLLDRAGSSWNWIVLAIGHIDRPLINFADIDLDGDSDLICILENFTSWWENTGDPGLWPEHRIEYGSYLDSAGDIDGDGDTDLAGNFYWDHDIVWMENLNSPTEPEWEKHIIEEGTADFYTYTSLVDLDNDGDLDFAVVSDGDCALAWFENTDGSGDTWIRHMVKDGGFDGWLEPGDINGDGFADIIVSMQWEGLVSWWDLFHHAPTGWLESCILDTQTEPVWGMITWESDEPAGTEIKFQVRASDDYWTMGEWSDTLDTPSSLTGILHDGDRYLQYRVILETADTEVTPVLNEVEVSWQTVGIGERSFYPLISSSLRVLPNPSNVPSVEFTVSESGPVSVTVFDLSGRSVCSFEGAYDIGGPYVFRPEGLVPGVYLCRMISSEFTATQRFIVIK